MTLESSKISVADEDSKVYWSKMGWLGVKWVIAGK